MLDGVSYDFFPISWERAERFATGRDGWAVGPSLIAHAKVLYSRSEKDLARFDSLKAQIDELKKPINKGDMVGRALAEFQKTLFYLGNLRLARLQSDLSNIRRASWLVVMSAVECLALVNQMYFNRGWDSNFNEILDLPVRPADLETSIPCITTSTDPDLIIDVAERLVIDTRSILLNEQRETAGSNSIGEMFTNYYPEIRDKVNKVLTRVGKNPVGASWAATFIQHEVAMFMEQAVTGIGFTDINLYDEYAYQYRKLSFPELMQFVKAGDEGLLAQKAEEFDTRVREWLTQNSIDLNYVESLEDLKRFLKGRQ